MMITTPRPDSNTTSQPRQAARLRPLSQLARKLSLVGLAAALCGGGTPAWAQQFRAAWADIFHVGLTSQSDVNTMISKLVAGRYNAVIVQVLGYMDNSTASHGAHWKSSIVPRSSRVTASFDPLAYVCQQAHANGIEVHAWLGGSGAAMYRVSTAWPPPGNSTLAAHPEWMMVPQANSEGGAVVAINGNYMLDMGSSDAQEYIVSIVRELVTNYPIDGIHWDDEHGSAEYNAGLGFPAYSATVYSNSGLARYRRNTGYVGTPGPTDSAYNDYRRRFKNELIARCQAEIQSIKTNPRQPLRHTAATMAYGSPPSTCTFTSEEAYTYYSDWPTMLRNGWLDAAIPMNYKTSAYDSMYRNWCDRAYACWRHGRHIYMGLGAYLNPKDYTVTQLQYAYNAGLNGGVTFSYAVPSSDGGDWWSYVAANLYTTAATVPTMPWRSSATATEGIVWGRVKEGRTGYYLDDATVTVIGGPTVKTDGNGYYIATLIPATAGGTLRYATAGKAGMVGQTTNALVLAGDIARYDFVLRGYTAIALSAISPNPACAGTAVSLTATVTGTNGPTGTVEFFDGAASLGTATLSSGSATKLVSGLSAGTHNSITAAYLGDGANSPSTSSAGSVTVNSPPTISGQPTSATNLVGGSVTFTVTAANAIAYQWRKGGTNISGATLSSYTINPVGTNDAASYDCVVSGASPCASVTSAAATLTVLESPVITTQPQSVTASAGSNVTFTVTAAGTPAPDYQWRFNGSNLVGATATIYTLTNVQTADAGSYSVVVSNIVGVITSTDAVLTVTQPTAPQIDRISVLAGGQIELQVSGEPGQYAVDGTTNLIPVDWVELTNLTTTVMPFQYVDSETNLTQRFYRVRRIP